MKKWIILGVLVIVLIAAVFIIEKLTGEELPVDTGRTEATTTEETYCEADLKLMEKTWEEYQEMTDEEKQEFKNSFTALQVYIDWYWQAKEVYDAKQDVQVILPGQNINIGDLIGGAE